MRELALTVEPRVLPIFSPILQAGFLFEARVGCSVREFLNDECGIAQETINDRISTIFLDGMPVDDLDRTIVTDRSTLALSGAMPGLMGATMRINSPFRSFRESISHNGGAHAIEPHHGMVRLKLFNTVMSELGRRFLKKGILLDALVIRDLLVKLAEKDRGAFAEILMDGETVDMGSVLNEAVLPPGGFVSLSVRVME